MVEQGNITVDAAALQERDDFRVDGWTQVMAPAKVNLHLAIGAQRADGYHEAKTVMHALSLHDTVYLRPMQEGADAALLSPVSDGGPLVRMVAGPGIVLPEVASQDNLAAKAVVRLAEALELPPRAMRLEVRIEKNIPAQAGLGGGSSDAAAALVGAAALWGVPGDDARIEAVARTLGADVAFFLHGGCAYLQGTGDEFSHALKPSKRAVALVKPEGGVSTAQAYRCFDEQPVYAEEDREAQVGQAKSADEISLFNNLAPASERLMPELAAVRTWLAGQEGVESTLLCGSGAATFAICADLSAAGAVVAEARKKGWWARSTSLSSARALAVRVVQAFSFGGGDVV